MDGSSNVNVESWESTNYPVVSEVNVETSYSPIKDPGTVQANESVTPVRYPLDGQSATGDHHGGYTVQVTEGYSTGYPQHYQDSPILTEAFSTTLPLGHYASGTESHAAGYDPNLLGEHYPTDGSVNHGSEYQQSVPDQHYSNNDTDIHQLDYTVDPNIPVDQHYAVIEADGNVQLTDNNYTLQDAHLAGHENETTAPEVSSPASIHDPTFITEQVVETVTVEPADEPPQLQPDIPQSRQEVTEIPADNPAPVPVSEEVPENNNQVEEKTSEVPEKPTESVLNKSVSDNVTIYTPLDSVNIDYIVPAADVNNSVQCLDLVLPVVDSASVTMTDPVSIGLKSTNASETLSEATKPIDSVPKRPKSGVLPALIKFEVKKARPGVSSASLGSEQGHPKRQNTEEGKKTDKIYVPPPHLLGRSVENSGQDPGKNIQQPRYCVKVPSRNLSSQIVTTKELAKELTQRAARNFTEPQGGDIFFAKKLTKRLAGHLSANAAKAKEMKEKQAATKSADDDLIAILEGEVDDWTIDQPPPQLIEAAKSPVSNHADPPKLDRAVEREIALRQLSTMPTPRRKKVSSPLKGLRLDLLDPMPGSSKSIPLRKRKIPAEAMMTDTSSPASNGQTSGPGHAEAEKKVVVKEPRIFKTKRSSIMTNGKPVASSPASATDVKLVAEVPVKKPKPVDAAKSVERNLISPPRTYSSRIKKSTYNDDFVFPSTSKSRVFPVVGKPQTPKVVANAVVSPNPSAGKVEDKPAVKKAERKPKTPASAKTPVMKAKVVKSATKAAKKPPKKLTEIDRLLMDEGAINMLYSVEKDEEQRRTAGSSPVVEVGPKKRMLKSVRYSQKNLLMKTRLVKSAVQRLKNEPEESTSVSLRGKRSTPGRPPVRKTSLDSSVSLDPGSPTQIFTYPPRLHPPAEASRIIRRHSSSSNFSSRSTSPNPSTRPSLGPTSPQPVQDGDQTQPANKQSRKRSNAIYIRNATPANKSKKKRKSGADDSIFQPAVSEAATIDKEVLKSQMAKNFQQIVKTKASRVTTVSGGSEGQTAAGEEMTACLAEAVTAFIAEDGNLDSSSLPPELPKQSLAAAASDSSSYSSLVLRLELDCAARAERSVQRTSLRQAYTGLCLHRHEHLVQLEVAPTNTRLPDALSAQVLHELSRALSHLSQDASCRAVLITSTGESFCAGLDLSSLIHDTADQRRVAATEMAEALRRFAGSLARFEKPLMAAVHGPAVGVGVAMLAHCDLVYASTDSSFHAPYSRLGQMPEAGAVVTLPQLIGNAATSELLIAGRTFTAPEAQGCGLVTRVLDADDFLGSVLPLASSIAAQSSQSMEATKALLRFNSRASIEATLAAETRLLVQHWTSAECQANIRQYVDEYDETK